MLLADAVIGSAIEVHREPAMDQLIPVHEAQVLTYLRLSGYPVGLLMNFNTTLLNKASAVNLLN
ncbi:MAG: GxxExxY protein [Acetobacteraceae bacterium]|nr:GxxExxY protein [Acetobacteraceae bacterium]